MRRWVVVMLISFAAIGCATRTTVDSSTPMQAGRAIAFGRLSIQYNGEDVSKKVYFRIKDQAGASYLLDLDESGIFLAPLPPGSYQFQNMVANPTFWSGVEGWDFKPGEGSFSVADASKAYYIGNVTVSWTGPAFKWGSVFALAGAVVDVATHHSEVSLKVEDHPVEATQAFRQRLGRDPDLVRSIAHVP